MYPCKIDHSDPDAIPRFLCARCNPDSAPTPEKTAQALAEIRDQQRAENAELHRKQELLRTKSRLEAIERRHHGDVGGVDGHIAKGLRHKIERLENGECLGPKRKGKRKQSVKVSQPIGLVRRRRKRN